MIEVITIHCNANIDKVSSHYYIRRDGLIKAGNSFKKSNGISICIEAENELSFAQENALQDLLEQLKYKYPEAKIASLQAPFDIAKWFENVSSGDTGIFSKMLADENKFCPKGW